MTETELICIDMAKGYLVEAQKAINHKSFNSKPNDVLFVSDSIYKAIDALTHLINIKE